MAVKGWGQLCLFGAGHVPIPMPTPIPACRCPCPCLHAHAHAHTHACMPVPMPVSVPMPMPVPIPVPIPTRVLPESYQIPTTRVLPRVFSDENLRRIFRRWKNPTTKIYVAFFVAGKTTRVLPDSYQNPTRILPDSYQGPPTDILQRRKFTSHFSSPEKPSDENLRRFFRR